LANVEKKDVINNDVGHRSDVIYIMEESSHEFLSTPCERDNCIVEDQQQNKDNILKYLICY